MENVPLWGYSQVDLLQPCPYRNKPQENKQAFKPDKKYNINIK